MQLETLQTYSVIRYIALVLMPKIDRVYVERIHKVRTVLDPAQMNRQLLNRTDFAYRYLKITENIYFFSEKVHVSKSLDNDTSKSKNVSQQEMHLNFD